MSMHVVLNTIDDGFAIESEGSPFEKLRNFEILTSYFDVRHTI